MLHSPAPLRMEPIRCARSRWWFVVVLVCCSVARSNEGQTEQIPITPTPPWVEPVEWTLPTGTPSATAPAEIVLSDQQSLLRPGKGDFFYRLVVQLNNAEGVRRHAEWAVTLAPEHDEVAWHTLRLHRNGAVQDRLPTAQFKRLQRELGFESQLLSGQITLATVLEDVRVGDVLEVAYTFARASPLFREHMSALHYLGAPYPTKHQLILVRTPREGPNVTRSILLPPGTRNLPDVIFRPASLRLGLEITETDDERLFRWEQRGVPAIPFDDNMSARAAPFYPLLRFSTFSSWSEVAAWATPLFEQEIKVPPDLHPLLAEWRRATDSDRDALLRRAIEWVQDEVRYFALAIGEHNLRPRPLTEICATRFGDCKDKATLLVAVLRELGFAAWPALVNTHLQDRVTEYGPHPYAFDHAIVAYDWDGVLRWLDPTLKFQSPSAPRNLAVPRYRSALVLRAGEGDLTPVVIPEDDHPDTETRDVIVVDPKTRHAVLTTETIIRGIQATAYRSWLQAVSPEDLSSRWFNFIGRFYKRLDEVSAPVVEDDLAANHLVIRAQYSLSRFAESASGADNAIAVHAYGLRALLDPPQSRRRRWPYALAADRFLRHRIEVELPFIAGAEQQPQVIVGDGVEYRVEKGLSGRHFTAVHDLRFTADFVPAERMSHFCDVVDEVLQSLSTSLRPSAAPSSSPNLTRSDLTPAAGEPAHADLATLETP